MWGVVVGRSDKSPDLEMLGEGLSAAGVSTILVDLSKVTHHDIDPKIDVAVVQGGPRRYRGAYRPILESLTPKKVLISEESPYEHPGSEKHFYLGWGKHFWVPEKIPESGRAGRLGLTVSENPSPGANILVLGQGQNHSKWINEKLQEIFLKTSRRVVWRPHPNHEKITPKIGVFDEVSLPSERSLEDELLAANFVITHSSAGAIRAMMMGVPAICSEDAGFSHLCLTEFCENPPPIHPETADFLERVAWSIWSESEIMSGEAMRFLIQENADV